MKYRILVLLVIAIALTSCKSKEQKAEDLIRAKLSQTLFDFSSYEPIETIVTEAYNTPYNDAVCFQLSMVVANHVKKMSKYSEEMTNAQDHMNIWGAPTYYSSTYSDSQYYKYKKPVQENLEKAKEELFTVKTLGRALQDSIKVRDSEKIIGWEVKHRFRCKTRGGHATIADYRYIIDKGFKNILFYEDMDDDDFSSAREIIEMAENNKFDEDGLDE